MKFSIKDLWSDFLPKSLTENFIFCAVLDYPVDTGHKLNVHKTFRRRPGRVLNVLCMFNLRPVSTGYITDWKLVLHC